MKLRTQLAVAFLLLAVLPLSGIVLYSYVSSEKAFRQAVWSETEGMTNEMEARLGAARQQIRDRITRLGDVGDASPQAFADAFRRIGAAELPFVESLEILPKEAVAGLVDGLQIPAPPPSPSPAEAPQAPAPPAARDALRELNRVLGPQVAAEIRRGIEAARREAQAHKSLSEAELRDLAARREESKRLLGELSCPLRTKGEVVGRIQAHIKAQALLDRIFAVRRDQGEIPFALDAAGTLYVTRREDKEKLARVPLSCDSMPPNPSWVVATKKDPESGLCFGVARPIRRSLAEMRGAAMRNFGYGLGLVGLCFAGVFPLSRRITRNLSGLMDGVERLTRGDLAARVPVRSHDEFGRLGQAFNHMAVELHDNQERLLEEERLRKEQEIERRLLEAEHARKSGELEQARNFQLSLLPRELPRRADLELAVYIRTATEVGGDYYDFLSGDQGALTIAIGDATGHGAAAGTMVTVVKGLFTARAGDLGPAEFLGHANEVIRRMQLGRMAMALAVLRICGRRLTVSSAGMPPLLIHRASGGAIEEISQEATPLGSLAEAAYPERHADLAPGDTLLLMSDGFPELLSPAGDPLGYPRAAELFAAAAGKDPEEVIAGLTAAGEAWSAGAPLHDDVTFVVVKMR